MKTAGMASGNERRVAIDPMRIRRDFPALNQKVYGEFNLLCGESRLKGPISPTGENLHVRAPSEPLPSLSFARRRRVGSVV